MKDHLVEFNKREGAQEYISLEKLIPKLPSSLFGLIFKSIPSLESIEKQKDSLSKYSQDLLDLIAQSCTHPNGPRADEDELEEAQITQEKTYISDPNQDFKGNSQWINLILNFFQLHQMHEKEQFSAKKIQAFFRNIKKIKLKKKFLQLIYLQKGYRVNILSLDSCLTIQILSFLSPREKYLASQICRDFRNASMHPSLWRELLIFNKQLDLKTQFGNFLQRSSQLKVLCLKFCPNVSAVALSFIAEHANPFYLRELYLDGCDKINDQALQNLVTKRQNKDINIPENGQFFNPDGNIYLHNFSSIASTQEEMTQTINEIGQGGACGLELISLAECKNINDTGVAHLKNLKFLNNVVLLGCFNVKDEGVKELAKNLKYLEDIDISGTSITANSLTDLVTLCLNLKRVNISGCKKLNASDEKILQKNKINVEGGDDVFRFYLHPDQSSELPKITTSVLKTRATLSMHKVYRYLIKKLQADRAIEELPEDSLADSQVEILCNGIVMNPQNQLKFVKEKHWHNTDQILTLHYRKREDAVSANNKTEKKEYQPRKPPLWIPDHLALNCLQCDREFTFVRRVHHCRNCGKCFCQDCSKNWMTIEAYGYFNPVRVCSGCKGQITIEKQKLSQAVQQQ